MKKITALAIALVMVAAVIGTTVAYAGGSNLPPTEVAPRAGVQYFTNTIAYQYSGLSAEYLQAYGNRYFLRVGAGKAKYMLELLNTGTVSHVIVPRGKIKIVRDVKYMKMPIIKLKLNKKGVITRATVYAAPGVALFAPSPGPQG